MTFTADAAYAAYTGQPDARLTILYNFPAFDLSRGCSRLYDPNSPYYNGFYGAYLVRDGSNAAWPAGTRIEGRGGPDRRLRLLHPWCWGISA